MSTPPNPTSGSARRPWRLVLVWTAFGAILVAGLALAARHGNEAPIVLDVVSE